MAKQVGGNGSVAQDPREAGPKPPFPKQSQETPGTEQAMRPKPDHGEDSYRGNGKLTGRAALITGADSGIGRAVALAFAREGADIVLSYLPAEEDDARESASWIEKAGRRAIRAPGDIQDQRHCRELVERTVAELGRIDILVNNAAYQKAHDDFTTIPAEDIERTFRTNIIAMFFLAQAAVPRMKAGSSIINTASIQARKPTPPILAYATTKGAIVTFTMGLAETLIERGIRVNAVAPGPVWTPLIPQTPMDTEDFGESSPIKRPAQPAELAPVYVFLASDDARYVNGGVYPVTGGMPME
ncbi:MAG: SDR family oxidoreductase [Chloroflexi bacterium]|nr:MAG: SDR family oxidoreductase [Chloroflexota bacterium]